METNREPVGAIQRVTILNYMEKHYYFARQQITKLGRNGKRKFDRMWKDLTDNLNEIGPAKKSIAGWKQAWDTIKSTSKQIKIKYNKVIKKTGNVIPKNVDAPNQFEDRVCDIYGVHGLGLNVVAEVGVQSISGKQYRPSLTDWKRIFDFLLAHPEIIDARSCSSPLWNHFASTYRIAEGPFAGQPREAKSWFKSWCQRRDTAIKNYPKKEGIAKLDEEHVDRLTIEVLLKGKEYPMSQNPQIQVDSSNMQATPPLSFSNLTPEQQQHLLLLASSAQQPQQVSANLSNSVQHYNFQQYSDVKVPPIGFPKVTAPSEELQTIETPNNSSKPSTFYIQQHQLQEHQQQPSSKSANPLLYFQQSGQRLASLLPSSNLQQTSHQNVDNNPVHEESLTSVPGVSINPNEFLKMLMQQPSTQALTSPIGANFFHQMQQQQSAVAAYQNLLQNQQVGLDREVMISSADRNSKRSAEENLTNQTNKSTVGPATSDQNKKSKHEDTIIVQLLQALLDEQRSHHMEMRKIGLEGMQKLITEVQGSIQHNHNQIVKFLANLQLQVVPAESSEKPAAQT